MRFRFRLLLLVLSPVLVMGLLLLLLLLVATRAFVFHISQEADLCLVVGEPVGGRNINCFVPNEA